MANPWGVCELLPDPLVAHKVAKASVEKDNRRSRTDWSGGRKIEEVVGRLAGSKEHVAVAETHHVTGGGKIGIAREIVVDLSEEPPEAAGLRAVDVGIDNSEERGAHEMLVEFRDQRGRCKPRKPVSVRVNRMQRGIARSHAGWGSQHAEAEHDETEREKRECRITKKGPCMAKRVGKREECEQQGREGKEKPACGLANNKEKHRARHGHHDNEEPAKPCKSKDNATKSVDRIIHRSEATPVGRASPFSAIRGFRRRKPKSLIFNDLRVGLAGFEPTTSTPPV